MNGFAALDIHPHRRYVVDIGGRRSSRCRLHINFALFLHSLDFTQNLGLTHQIIIDTPILTLTLSCLFGGFSTVLKRGFYEYYLGIQHHPKGYHEYEFNVEVSVKFKVRSLFSKDKELYYAWIDSFLDEITSYIDTDAFFDKINWDTVYSLIHCYKTIDKANQTT